MAEPEQLRARRETPDYRLAAAGREAAEDERREVEVMTTSLADPTVWLRRELLHACWSRKGDASS